MDRSTLTNLGIDTEAGLSYTGSEEKYTKALRLFSKNYEKNRSRTEEAFAAKDLESYRIIVHSLKSNAKMIGAMDLSRKFEALEMAAKDGDTAVMEADTAGALEQYRSIAESLYRVVGEDSVKQAEEISAEEAKGVAEALLAALDDFDDDLSKELLQKLTGFPFEAAQEAKLRSAGEQIDDFMYDEAADLIRALLPHIA